MLDDDQIAMLVYNHVVQLSLIDHEIDAAFLLAHEVAARAFDPAWTRAGIDAARRLPSPQAALLKALCLRPDTGADRSGLRCIETDPKPNTLAQGRTSSRHVEYLHECRARPHKTVQRTRLAG